MILQYPTILYWTSDIISQLSTDNTSTCQRASLTDRRYRDRDIGLFFCHNCELFYNLHIHCDLMFTPHTLHFSSHGITQLTCVSVPALNIPMHDPRDCLRKPLVLSLRHLSPVINIGIISRIVLTETQMFTHKLYFTLMQLFTICTE